MSRLTSALARAEELDVEAITDSIQRMGFSCTRCGACCRYDEETGESHTATIFPDEVRQIVDQTHSEWRDVARPMPYGLEDGKGETFEWALQNDACGDCRFYNTEKRACSVYDHRPRICRTYPFQVALPGVSAPTGSVVAEDGLLQAFACEGLGREIDRKSARELAKELKERAIVEIEESMSLLEHYDPTANHTADIVVHDSEGTKFADGTLSSD